MADPQAPSPPSDDDLAELPAPPRGKSPVMALVVIALAGVLLWHLRADLAYSLSSRAPAQLGDARSLAARGVTLSDNRYVTVSGQAERRYALYIEPKGGKDRETLFRLFGAGTRLFVRAHDTTDRTTVDDKWTGRLRRFDTLPYHEQLRKYYREQTQVTRYLSLESLKQILALDPNVLGHQQLLDRGGQPIALSDNDTLLIDVDYPGELKVYLSQDKFPSLADARHELDRMGLSPSAGDSVRDEFVFVVPLPDAKKNDIVGALSARDFAFQPREERFTARRKDLALVGDTLKIDAHDIVPFARVKAVGVPAPIDIGHDAFILIEDEAPGDFFWVPLVAGMLIAFAVFNVWYLLRTRRRAET